jgi:hypothetical protein
MMHRCETFRMVGRPLGQSSDAARRRARFQTAMEEWHVIRPEVSMFLNFPEPDFLPAS